MKIFVAVFVILIYQSAFSQLYPEFTKFYGEPVSFENANTNTLDTNGNRYMAGSFKTTSFGGILRYSKDARGNGFLVKYDAEGNLLWFKTIESTDEAEVDEVHSYGGRIYISGTYKKEANFGFDQTGQAVKYEAPKGIFTASYTLEGELVWARSVSSENNTDLTGMAVSEAGVFLTGLTGNISYSSSYPKIFFTPEDTLYNYLIPSKTYDGFLVKYDLEGTYDWHRHYSGSSGSTYPQDMDIHEDKLYIYGIFSDDIYHSDGFNFDTLSVPWSKSGRFFEKYDVSNGSVNWFRQSSQNLYSGSQPQIKVTGDNLWLSCLYRGDIDISPVNLTVGVPGTYDYEQALINYDLDGNYRWMKSFDSDEIISVFDLETDTLTSNLILSIYPANDSLKFKNHNGEILQNFVLNSWSDQLVMTLDTLGNYISHVRFGNLTTPGLTIGGDQLLFTGQKSFDMNFSTPYVEDKDTLKIENSSAILANYSKKNGFDWFRQEGSTYINSESFAQATCLDDSGNVYTTGYFVADILLSDSTYTSAGDKDMYLVKYNSAGEFCWARVVGGSGDDIPGAILWEDGNLYVTGSFNSTVNFSLNQTPGFLELTSDGASDIFVVKYSSDTGDPSWVRRAGGPQADVANDIAFHDDYLYISGGFRQTANFNSPSASGSFELVTRGGYDVYLWKLNIGGTNVWVRRGGSDLFDEALAVDANVTGVYIAGSFNDTADFNTPSNTLTNSLSSLGDRDGFLAKFNHMGDLQWLKRLGGINRDRVLDVKAVSLLDVVVTGIFEDSLTIGSGLTQITGEANRDAFLVSFKALSGVKNWEEVIRGPEDISVTALAARDGELLVGGFFEGTARFGEALADTVVSDGMKDIFWATYSPQGEYMSYLRAGGFFDDELTDISFRGERFVSCGNFLEIANFNTPSNINYNQLFSFSAQRAFTARGSYSYRYDNSLKEGDIDTGYYSELDGVAADDTENIYQVGVFDDRFKEDGFELTGEGSHRFLTKSDKTGKTVWARPIYLQDYIYDKALIEVSGAAVLVASEFEDTLTFNLTEDYSSNSLYTNLYDDGVFLASFDQSSSDLNWAVVFNFESTVSGISLSQDAGGIYLAGNCHNSLVLRNLMGDTLKTVESSERDYYTFLAKFDHSGNLLWLNYISSDDIELDSPGLCTANGHVYLLGDFEQKSILYQSTGTLEDSLSGFNSGSTSGLLVCFDGNGNYQWYRSFLVEQLYEADLTVTGEGIYTSLVFTDTLNFSQPYSQGLQEYSFSNSDEKVAVAKFNLSGDFQWVRFIEEGQSYFTYLELLSDDNSVWFVTEVQTSEMKLSNPEITSDSLLIEFSGAGSYGEMAFVEYGFNGDLLTALSSGMEDDSYLNDVTLEGGEFYIVGYMSESNNPAFSITEALDIQPLQSNPGFLLKLLKCGDSLMVVSPDHDIDGTNFTQAAATSISATNNLENGTQAYYTSEVIELNPGFLADTGTVFKAETGGCGN